MTVTDAAPLRCGAAPAVRRYRIALPPGIELLSANQRLNFRHGPR